MDPARTLSSEMCAVRGWQQAGVVRAILEHLDLPTAGSTARADVCLLGLHSACSGMAHFSSAPLSTLPLPLCPIPCPQPFPHFSYALDLTLARE